MLTFVEVIKVYVESALHAFYLRIKGIRSRANFIQNIVSRYLAGPGSAKLCAKRGVACLVSHWRKLLATEEPDALIAHVRVCGEGAG